MHLVSFMNQVWVIACTSRWNLFEYLCILFLYTLIEKNLCFLQNIFTIHNNAACYYKTVFLSATNCWILLDWVSLFTVVMWAVAMQEKGHPLLACELILTPVDVLGVQMLGSWLFSVLNLQLELSQCEVGGEVEWRVTPLFINVQTGSTSKWECHCRCWSRCFGNRFL